MNVNPIPKQDAMLVAGSSSVNDPLQVLLNQLRDGVVSLWASGPTASRPTDPYLGQLYYDTTLGTVMECTAVRVAGSPGTAAVWVPFGGVYAAQTNLLYDGECQIGQGAAVTLTTAPKYGKVDMWAGWASGGAVTGGTVDQVNGGTNSSTLFGLLFSGFTLTGAGVLSARQRLSGIQTRTFAPAMSSAGSILYPGVYVQTDIPAAVAVTMVVRAATVFDNFAATTVLFTIPMGNCPAASAALLTAAPIDLANTTATNGIEVEIQVAVGAVGPRNVIVADVQLRRGGVFSPNIPMAFQDSLQLVRTYFQKSFPYFTAPAQNSGNTSGALSYAVQQAGVRNGGQYARFSPAMRANGTPTMVTFNPNAANANWRNFSLGADSGVVSFLGTGEAGVFIVNGQAAGDALGNGVGIHWTADARF